MQAQGEIMHFKVSEGVKKLKQARCRLVQMLKIDSAKLTAIQRGDQVYYILDPVELTFARGIVKGADKDGILLDCQSGGEVKVSPFAIVPNPNYL